MKILLPVLLCSLLVAQTKPMATPETLRYNVNWPSGLSLGEGQLSAAQADGKWTYAFTVEASVPGYALSESATSRASGEGCSFELTKSGTRGKRKLEETTTFDQKKMTAVRKTKEGGTSDLSLSPCAKDALAFLYHVRSELVAGRLPQSQKVYYGAAYQATLRYIGNQMIRIGGESIDAEHLTATLKGPGSEVAVDLYFARDAKRTPLLVQAPLPLGKFSLELAR